MWCTTRRYLILGSFALNLAFVAAWIAYAAASQTRPEQVGEPTSQPTIWCPLHQELDVSEEQWAQIEPRLADFQASVGELRQQVRAMRPSVIDLIAAEQPDLEAIRAKQDEILATKREIQGLVVSHLIAEKQILTPDQQTQLFEMLREQIGRSASPPMSGPSLQPGMAPALSNHQDNVGPGGTR